ncbi:MAG: Asp-tRNA(Asn)/Glu-tRNA(Gln) amidotransferase subunit GatB [Chloroflexi bacterium]|nr:Asp-tRNA(Asn)/Glu-tRNA(Gln) amidotransferase subunit GatB [Chloroflexota bacterium]
MTTTTQEAPAGSAYEPVIGLEVHAQLATSSKMFCGCSRDYWEAEPNSHVCPVCLGMPGVLPVINRRAVELTILTGLALGCTIPPHAKFDRKNYPYPDLMKGYQISQYDQPLCVGGTLDIEVEGVPHTVHLERIHLEEDTARLLHRDDAGGARSLLDVNRAGVPLMEIVSEPDMHSAEQAVAYLRKLRQMLRYIGASDADMEKGSFRCDANVSLRPRGRLELGTKVEVKNMNSFRAVGRAIESEIRRQTAMLDAGERIEQETRGYLDASGETASQRSKEEAHDYRYFPEPDLPPLAVNEARIEAVRAELPELPDARRIRFEEEHGLTPDEARVLTESRQRADDYERTVHLVSGLSGIGDREDYARTVAHWFTGDVARLLNTLGADAELGDTQLTPGHVAELAGLVAEGTITASTAKEVLEIAFESGELPQSIVQSQGLGQVRDEDEIDRLALEVIAAQPKAVADYRGGKESAVGFLVGQLMRATRGRTDPQHAAEVLRRHLDG